MNQLIIPSKPLDRTNPEFKDQMLEYLVYFKLLKTADIPAEGKNLVSFTEPFLDSINRFFRKEHVTPQNIKRGQLAIAVIEYLGGDLEDMRLLLDWKKVRDVEKKTRLMYDICDTLKAICKKLDEEGLAYEQSL